MYVTLTGLSRDVAGVVPHVCPFQKSHMRHAKKVLDPTGRHLQLGGTPKIGVFWIKNENGSWSIIGVPDLQVLGKYPPPNFHMHEHKLIEIKLQCWHANLPSY